MADNLLLASERVKPEVLEKTGYKFLYPSLVPALKHLLKK
jgi:NAD dependent epimerase/dehydratase family enzyme